MTKQEEIREEITRLQKAGMDFEGTTDAILKYLHSQGVVIDRTLLDLSGNYAMEIHRYEPLITVKK